MDNATMANSFVSRVKALDPDEDRRFKSMGEFIGGRSCICLCQLIVRFHVGKQRALAHLSELVNAGKFRREKWLPYIGTDAPEWVEWALYVAEGQRLESKQVTEVTEATVDTAFAVGILKECFPGYQPGVKLDEQGAIGQQVRRALRGAVAVLSDTEAVPSYWSAVRQNSTSIVLTLRQVFGSPAEIRSFLRQVQDYPEGIRGAVRNIKRDAEMLVVLAKEAATSLDSGIDKLEKALAH
jgi:hypothetical protein